jgi:hypothetical protein
MTFNQSRPPLHGRLPDNYIPSRYYFNDQHIGMLILLLFVYLFKREKIPFRFSVTK